MRVLKIAAMVIAGCAIFGCDSNAIKDPPLTITFRNGVLSKQVMQVNNLSTSEGIEVYVYVASADNSIRSGNVVVPANSAKEFGALELAWEFKPGDKGFVKPVKYGKKLFFEVCENNQFKKWFGYDDIPEVDVAAQVRARQKAEHEAWLKAATDALCLRGRGLFDAITVANTNRVANGLAPLWPKGHGSLKERAKEKLKGWKDKISAKFAKDEKSVEPSKDVSDMKFGSSAEYFAVLMDVVAGAENHKPYLTGIDIAVVSASEAKDGTLSNDSVRWSVIADYTEDLSDLIPVIVSANMPCEKLRSFWDGKETADDVIPLANTGDTKNESVIFIYKSGLVKALPADKVTLANIYAGSFNTCTNGYNRQVRYITPAGLAETEGMQK